MCAESEPTFNGRFSSLFALHTCKQVFPWNGFGVIVDPIAGKWHLNEFLKIGLLAQLLLELWFVAVFFESGRFSFGINRFKLASLMFGIQSTRLFLRVHFERSARLSQRSLVSKFLFS